MTPPAPTTARERLAQLLRDESCIGSRTNPMIEWGAARAIADAILRALPDLLVDEAAVERAIRAFCTAYWSPEEAAIIDSEATGVDKAVRAALRAGVSQ